MISVSKVKKGKKSSKKRDGAKKNKMDNNWWNNHKENNQKMSLLKRPNTRSNTTKTLHNQQNLQNNLEHKSWRFMQN